MELVIWEWNISEQIILSLTQASELLPGPQAYAHFRLGSYLTRAPFPISVGHASVHTTHREYM